MSRCFPYPPPGYCRNGAPHDSLIESIKLEKQTDKSKSERKKEKRVKKEEKRQKEKRNNGEEKVNKKQKKNAIDQKTAEFKKTEPNTVQLERSDLSEEHGPPVTLHRPSYSSDSTQNSNKRKRDDVILPEGPTVHGKPIKIRLLKKQKGPDQIPVKETETVPSVPSVSNSVKESLVLNNRKVEAAVPATSGRENGPVSGSETRNNDPNGLLSVGKQSARPILPPVASGSRNSEVQISNYGRPVLPETRTGLDKPGPSRGPPSVPSVSRKPSPLVARKRSINELSLPVPTVTAKGPTNGPINGPMNGPTNGPLNGPTRPEKKKDPVPEVQKKVGPTRHEKKLLKKHSKYEKVVGGWVPPVLEAQLPAYNDDEDWLSRKGKTVKSSLRNDVDKCQEVGAGAVSSLWQPCARFLVEADMHAMPYTVPF